MDTSYLVSAEILKCYLVVIPQGSQTKGKITTHPKILLKWDFGITALSLLGPRPKMSFSTIFIYWFVSHPTQSRSQQGVAYEVPL